MTPKFRKTAQNGETESLMKAASCLCRAKKARLFEIARVLVRFNHVASVIVNANQCTM
jgi:hypothetical protein